MMQACSTHGLPEQCVSDNATCFTSHEFKAFLEENGIHQILVSPHHPLSNGQAERVVQSFKEAMKRSEGESVSLQRRVSRFLLRYRVTPHTTTQLSPAELMMGRKLRTRLDLLRPDGG